MRIYLIVLLLFFVSSCSNGQISISENNIDFATTGINKEQSELIYTLTNSFPNNTQLSIGIIRNGVVEFIGIERKEDSISLLENYQNVFEIGSITKIFTATLLSNFVIDGTLQLDENIQNHFDFKFNTDEIITFEQLANHTSGLPRLPTNLNLLFGNRDNPYKEYNNEKLTEYLSEEVKLNQPPGTSYAYSNLGAGLLGFELGIISNTTYEELLQNKIFSRYNMMRSTSKRENINANLVNGLNPNGEKATNWDYDVLAGGGAIFSTVEDLSKFALAQFYQNNKELMLTHKPTFKVNQNMTVALGWHILKGEKETEVIWHNGGTGGYSSSMVLDLDNNNGIIILSNVSAYNKKMGNIDKLCFGLMKTLKNQ